MTENEFKSPEAAGQTPFSPQQEIKAPWDTGNQKEQQQYRKRNFYQENSRQTVGPEDIDLSGFQVQPQKQKRAPYITTILTIMTVALFAVIFGITKTIREMNNEQSRWQTEYVLEETKKGINDKYNIVGAKNNGDTVQLLLEQTSDDKEVTAKVTVIFYDSQNACDLQSGNGTMHGKGTNCIIEIKPNVSSFDHMNIINEE